MQVKFELQNDVLRVEIRQRETAKETREFAERALAEREKHGVLAILLVLKDSRPIFKVEEYGLSQLLQRIAAVPGLRVASVSDDSALRSSQEYIAFLAKQRDAALRAFASEGEALAWLREPR